MIDTTHEQLPPKQEITAEEFIKIWKGWYKDVESYKHHYQYANYESFVLIKECIIVGNIVIEKMTGLPDLELVNSNAENFIIDNCQLGSFKLDGSSIKDFQINNNSQTDNIYIINKSTAENFEIANNSKIGAFEIDDISTIKSFYLFYKSRTFDIRISRQSKAEYFHIEDSEASNIIISNSSTRDFYISEKSTIKRISIDNGSVAGRFNIRNGSIVKDFEVNDRSTTGHIQVTGNSSVDNIKINRQSTLTNILVNKSSVEYINILDSSHVYDISLRQLNESSKTLTLAGSTLSNLRLKLDKPYQLTIKEYRGLDNSIKRAVIHNLHFYNSVFPKDSILQISQTDINSIFFSSFLNFGCIVFSDIKPVDSLTEFESTNNRFIKNNNNEYTFKAQNIDSTFIIHNSDLGNTQFVGCDLAAFTKFEFLNSKIANIFLADTKLPSKNQISTLNANEYEQRKLALSQFKKIYENQGDVVRATQYRAEQMEVYRKQLKHEVTTSRQDWWNNKAERCNLWLNKFSNYYGNNWLKAVGLTLFFNSILYTFYCWSQGYWFGGDWNTFWTLAAYSFEFLNPLRKADFLEHITGKHPSAGAIAIDYVSRIIIAYFVYQTITAFRKFGKSSS